MDLKKEIFKGIDWPTPTIGQEQSDIFDKYPDLIAFTWNSIDMSEDNLIKNVKSFKFSSFVEDTIIKVILFFFSFDIFLH